MCVCVCVCVADSSEKATIMKLMNDICKRSKVTTCNLQQQRVSYFNVIYTQVCCIHLRVLNYDKKQRERDSVDEDKVSAGKHYNLSNK